MFVNKNFSDIASDWKPCLQMISINIDVNKDIFSVI